MTFNEIKGGFAMNTLNSALKNIIENDLRSIGEVVLAYMDANGGQKIPATQINEDLGLKRECYPMANEERGPKGWLLQIIMRQLEEQGKIVHSKISGRTYYSLVNGS